MNVLKCCRTFLVVLIFCSIYHLSYAGTIKGMVQFHPASPSIIYDWFSYVPKSISKQDSNFILVTITGGLFDYTENTEQVRLYTESIKSLAETYRFILLTPSIPRTNVPTDIYTMAFDRQSFLSTTDPLYQRPDLKINQMIDYLTNELEAGGYNVNEKVCLEGFSAGGMFVQRYALIHPKRVQAIAAGQCGGSLTLPVTVYDGTIMPWAIGISDLSSLSGVGFNSFIYRQIPQYIYIGENDLNNSHFKWANPDGFWTQDQIDFINSLFGNTDPVRVSNMASYMNDIGCNVYFKSYTKIGHEIMPWITPSVYTDIYSFLSQHKAFIIEPYHPIPAVNNLLLTN